MFGYINVFKDELKIKDYNIYRAYYCGLCREIGRNHGQLSRLSLSYELTFLAILADSFENKDADFCMEGCIKHIGKRKTAKHSDNLSYASDINVLLTYYKLKDDIADNHSIKALFAIIPFVFSSERLKRKYPDLCKNLELHLKRLSFLEESGCDVIDKAAFEFAEIMKHIFLQKSEKLADLGYSLGRLIYILDAYDDMNDDLKEKNYNPALLQYSYCGIADEALLESMKNNLYYALADTAEKYACLGIEKNKEILDNIIYLGLRKNADRVLLSINGNERIKK